MGKLNIIDQIRGYLAQQHKAMSEWQEIELTTMPMWAVLTIRNMERSKCLN